MVETTTINEGVTASEKPEEVTEQSSRPDWLPEKFSSPEDMAKAYGELEGKLGKPAETPESSDTAKEENLNIDKAEEAVESAGLSMENLQQEYDSNGQLDEKSYEALEKAGITKDYVDAFINGQQALANQRAGEIKGIVGGNENYSDMMQWAKQNLNAQEIDAYNVTVNGRDIEQTKLAVMGLQARYSAAEGIEPNLVRGRSAGEAKGGYRSWAEVTTAMKDPRYQSDEAFRNDVQNKISNSQL
tara:strand:+ start:10365 stop:11096 length:732 start_codon:yes stop_codon:yes gene_type:complete